MHSADSAFSEHFRKQAHEMVGYDDQAAVDAAFADLAHLLDETPRQGTGCTNCGSHELERSANVGHCVHYCTVCRSCGAVQADCFGQDDAAYFICHKASSNYKRIHHWHERISQFLLCESPIPHDKFLLIAERLCDGSHAVINKDVIRSVLRSLNLQLYIEKWLQIIQRITLIEPPKPGAMLLRQLDDMFQELQTPFLNYKSEQRKNFLNYNYVFCRLFQRIGCPQFSMFFPLIKSRTKLKALDDMWEHMTASLGWQATQLQLVPPFAVRLETPELQLQRLRQLGASAVPAAMRTVPEKTGFRKSDQHLLRELDQQKELKRRRSTPPEPVPQRPGSTKRRLLTASAAAPQPLRRLLPQRRLV